MGSNGTNNEVNDTNKQQTAEDGSKDLEGLTAEERVQVEQARAATAEAAARRATAKAELAKLQSENLAMKFQSNWADCLRESEVDA